MESQLVQEFLRLIEIMNTLREKCPWDQKQTIHTLRHLTIEETYELSEAVAETNWKAIREELGDLLLHIVFYSKIGEEEKQFTLRDVIHGICEKLIARHPHIYGNVHVNNEEEVKRNWEKLKLKEGKKSVLAGIPVSLPAMIKAMRLQEKARQTGFDWEHTDQVWEKIEEEIREFKTSITKNNTDATEEEFGDLLFSLINYARFLHINPENALEKTNKKFMERFTEMESKALQQGKKLSEMTLQEMDEIWNSIKKQRSAK